MKLPNIWFGWILIVGLIVISSVSATPGDICTTHSQCEAGEYCYDAGACSQCFDNNACSIYGNSIDGDCSKCSTPNYYCVTACMTSVNDNSCGDNNGQTHECVSYLEAAISNPENVANSWPTNIPAGFWDALRLLAILCAQTQV